MRLIVTIVIFVLFSMSAKSQITKGTWLLGGTVNFSSIKTTNASYPNTVYPESNTIHLGVSPNVGYFLMDRFAAGLRISFDWDKFKTINGLITSNNSRYTVGPFARYYFLDTEKPVNLFTEASYQLGSVNFHPQNGPIHIFLVAAGPVVYFNSSIGLEFTIGYYQRSEEIKDNYKTEKKSFQLNIGLQIHLSK
ncbi:MAG: outer membrane beta-barrel protein [Sediminibacterium magnilacihabitans]|jgi:hypothetical protein|nr:outer membrane beta-barrel protein [Sediminibacterium magnilacihabitans]PQV59971.1 outer membrane protein with beta-barrel domain [Sediminibacterium magnilacihabitans]